MIARLWRARIDPARGAEYDTFARERSLPTFAAHAGFRGCAFLGDGADRSVLTLWESAADADRLDTSPRYRATVAAIMAAGFVLSAEPVVVADVSGYGRPDR
ncbi:hypothetical protein ACQEVB_00985 [Pseudonocardia sp. CA-107938]|uniref:hypothetical protein n=1 Tax=Pseudonocardia sp. CA-107938 TaxID=3240021 RepID=UPI003D94118A